MGTGDPHGVGRSLLTLRMLLLLLSLLLWPGAGAAGGRAASWEREEGVWIGLPSLCLLTLPLLFAFAFSMGAVGRTVSFREAVGVVPGAAMSSRRVGVGLGVGGGMADLFMA